METLNKDNKHEFDNAIIKEIEDHYTKDVWNEEYTEFLVGTDRQADQEADRRLDSLIEDVVLGQIDEALQCYFDTEGFKQDRLMGGRGEEISNYDGIEHEVEVGGVDYYIYRIN